MKTVIYCFSATGNSLTTARLLAGGLGECGIRPVAPLMGEDLIAEEAEAVGFVFPVYFSNMPWPVRRAISAMVFRENAYIFAVTTCRGHAGEVAKRMDQLLKTRGQKLSLWMNVDMPGNSYINAPEVDRRSLENQGEAVRRVVGPILRRETGDYACADALPATPMISPVNFRGITADDSCDGCGVCARVCPMNNITMAGGRALIGDRCATCLACFHWCPREAVYMSRQENIARRSKYHHPEVELRDISELMKGH